MAASEPPLNGRVLAERYQLGVRRGAGVDVAIFEAVDLQLDRVVSVRVVHPDLCAAPDFAPRFRAIMQQVASLKHPNLQRVHDWGAAQWNGREVQFVVTENLTGGSLRDLLDRGRLLTQSQVLMVGLDACRGLDAAHRVGLVHGDIRPSNLIFGADGTLRVAELGLAGLVTGPTWADPAQIGVDRAKYASPEQAQGIQVDPKTDVYSLCLSLVESIRGSVPFVGDSTVATLANRVDRLLPVSADFGPLASVFERAARPDRTDRYSAAEFGRAMVQAAERLPRPAPIPLIGGGLFAEAAPASTRGVKTQSPVDDRPTEAMPISEAAAKTTTSSGDLTGSIWRPLPPPTADGAPPTQPPVPVAAAAPVNTSAIPTDIDSSGPFTIVEASPVRQPGPAATTVQSAVPTADSTTVMASVPPPPTAGVERPLLREKRSRRKLIAVVMIVVLALAAGGVAAWYLNRTQSHTVPDLVGLDEGEALNQVSDLGWKIITTEASSDTVGSGAIISTDPPAGTSLKEGKNLTLVLSTGPAPRVLPEFTGLTLEQAMSQITELDLVGEQGPPEASETAPVGTVVRWSVAEQPNLVAGSTVFPKTVVQLILSSGPAPRSIPDLTGLSLVDATTKLTDLGLTIVQLPDEFSPDIVVGGVARQDPATGVSVERGTPVSVALSKGPDLRPVPALADLTVQQATDALAAVGLVIGEVQGDPAGFAVAAEVDGVELVAGQMLPVGTAVDITFEVPPPPTTLPPETTLPPDPATTTTVAA